MLFSFAKQAVHRYSWRPFSCFDLFSARANGCSSGCCYLLTGKHWKGLSSVILSLVSREADIFVNSTIVPDQVYNDFIDESLPAYATAAGVNSTIEAQYPPIFGGTNRKYLTERDRFIDFEGDLSFQ